MKVGLNVDGCKHHFCKVYNHDLRAFFSGLILMFWISWVHQLWKVKHFQSFEAFCCQNLGSLSLLQSSISFFLYLRFTHFLCAGLIIKLSNFIETLPFNEILFHYHKFARTSGPSSKLMLCTSNFWKELDLN
jgi:hypothetical protein